MKNPMQPAINKIIKTLLRIAIKKPSQFASPRIAGKALDKWSRVLAKLKPTYPKHTTIYPSNLPPLQLAIYTPKQANIAHTILFTHGGAFVGGGTDSHGAYAQFMANLLRARVVLPLYALAPEHVFPTAQLQLMACTLWVASQYQVAPSQLHLVGDSAGGCLTMALALRLIGDGHVPASICVQSPMTDLRFIQPSYKERGDRDPLLSASILSKCSQAYMAGALPSEPLISPVLGDYRALIGKCPVLIQVGSEEILYSDSEALHNILVEQGVSSTLSCYNGMWHSFQLLNGLVPQANKAAHQLADFIRNRSAQSPPQTP